MTALPAPMQRREPRAQGERGIVLLLVLIILVVLSGAAIWAAKASISGEQVANNIRTSANVTELAELALRYCEYAVIQNKAAVIRLPIPVDAPSDALPNAWQTLTNWPTSAGKTNQVPEAQLQDALGYSPAQAPVCMIEVLRLAPIDMQRMQGFLITARGFSQDYVEAANGAITSGTDAWVQSMIRF